MLLALDIFETPMLVKKFAKVEEVAKKNRFFLITFLEVKKNASKVPFLGPTRKDDSELFLSGLHSSSKSDFRYPTPQCRFTRLVVKKKQALQTSMRPQS